METDFVDIVSGEVYPVDPADIVGMEGIHGKGGLVLRKPAAMD